MDSVTFLKRTVKNGTGFLCKKRNLDAFLELMGGKYLFKTWSLLRIPTEMNPTFTSGSGFMFHSDVVVFPGHDGESQALVKAGGGAVIGTDGETDGELPGLGFRQQAANQGRAYAPAAVFGQQFDVDEQNPVMIARDHPGADVLAAEGDDRAFRSGVAGAVVGAAQVILVADKFVFLRGVPAGAGQLGRSGGRVETEKKAFVGRSRRAKHDRRRILGGGRFHGEAVAGGGAFAPAASPVAICKYAGFCLVITFSVLSGR